MAFRRRILLAAAALVVLPTAASAGDARTTRIETRPFYGATVTLEHGVRVFRPLPPHERVIINPGGKTPLSLGYETHRSTSRNYYDGGAGAGYAGPVDDGGSYGSYGPYGSHGGHAGHGRHHGRAPWIARSRHGHGHIRHHGGGHRGHGHHGGHRGGHGSGRH